MILAPNAAIGNRHGVRIHTVEERTFKPVQQLEDDLDLLPFTSAI